MHNKLDEISFSEFLWVISEYVQLAKESNNNPIELEIFEQQHPEMFSEEAENFIHDFLNTIGFTDELLHKLKSKNDIESNNIRLMKNIVKN